MNNFLIIDFFNLLRREMGALAPLEFNGRYTSGIYGFLRQFAKAVVEFKPTKIIVCADCPPYWRKEIFPEYKNDRKTNPDLFFRKRFEESIQYCEEFLSLINCTFWKEKGYEADDLIASVLLENKYDNAYIFSNDWDIFQLLFLRDNVYVKTNNELWNVEMFIATFGLETKEEVVRYLSLKGTHNNIKGIKGIGEVKAKEIATDENKWKAIYKEHKQELDNYYRLIVLPAFGEWEHEPRCIDISTIQFSERKLFNWITSIGIQYTKNMKEAFDFLGGF